MTTRTTRLDATLRVVAIWASCPGAPGLLLLAVSFHLILLVVVPSLRPKWRRRRRY